MKLLWIGPDREEFSFFQNYARGYGMEITPDTELLAATDEDDAVLGFLSATTVETMQMILFFFIFAPSRGRGVGNFLLKEYLRIAALSGIKMVRCSLPNDLSLHRMFQRMGFDLFPGEKEYAISFKALDYSEKFRNFFSQYKPGRVKYLNTLSDDEKRKIDAYIKEHEVIGGYDQEFSTVHFVWGRVSSLMLCEKIRKGLALTFMEADKNNLEYLVEHFRALYRIVKLSKMDPQELVLLFDVDEERNIKLAKVLGGDSVPIQVRDTEVIAVKSISTPAR